MGNPRPRPHGCEMARGPAPGALQAPAGVSPLPGLGEGLLWRPTKGQKRPGAASPSASSLHGWTTRQIQ
eukprot:8688968-Pyramimonas_sp.AAC.1